jgi:hypothetical protein
MGIEMRTKTIIKIGVLVTLLGATLRARQVGIDQSSGPSTDVLTRAGWKAPSSGSASLPSGMIVLIDSGSCPAGFTEDDALAGNYLLVTKTANADVGTTGGSNSYTPAGTNSTVSFTPAGTNGAVSFTPTGTNGTVSFTPAGSNSSTTVSATGTKFTTSGSGTAALTAFNGTTISNGTNTLTIPAETFAGAAGTVPAESFTGTVGAVPAETFTGTPGTVPAETFTGVPATLAPVFRKVIACKAN